jgi:peroxisomal membrane protein 4
MVKSTSTNVITMLDSFVCEPKLHDVLTLAKAARNGAVFGAKVRFPHALATVMMFGQGNLLSRLLVVLQLTRQHSKMLALYAFTYKAIMVLLRNFLSDGKETTYYPAIAGGVAGCFVFGSRNPINEQLVMYAASRALATVVIPKVKRVIKSAQQSHAKMSPLSLQDPNLNFRIFSTVSWAIAMYLYTQKRDRMGSSLVSTMDYLYAGEHWTGIKGFLGI